MTVFEKAFEKTIGHEQGFTKDPFDNGNWTGGKRNVGELKGTKYGISAAAYPHLDIENLTLDQAKGIYMLDYWNPLKCYEFDEQIAIELFDTAVNAGKHRGATIFQEALNYTNRNQRDYENLDVDGDIGRLTINAYKCNRYKEILFTVMNIIQGKFYLSLMDKNEGYEKYIGWFRRIEVSK